MNDCFSVLKLSTRYFTDECNLVSYISATMAYEMLNIHYFSSSWLQRQDVGPLPEITNSEWLSSRETHFIGLSLSLLISSFLNCCLFILFVCLFFFPFFFPFFFFCFVYSTIPPALLLTCTNMHNSTYLCWNYHLFSIKTFSNQIYLHMLLLLWLSHQRYNNI